MTKWGIVQRIPPERLKPRDVPRPLHNESFHRAFRRRLQVQGYSPEQIGAIDTALRSSVNQFRRQKGKSTRKPISEIGDVMEDATVYAGISPDTGTRMFTTPANAPLRMTWREAMGYAAGLDAHGHKDWRLPSAAELDVLYKNQSKGALAGTFSKSISGSGWYWSSSEAVSIFARIQRFSNGYRHTDIKYTLNVVRCVRS